MMNFVFKMINFGRIYFYLLCMADPTHAVNAERAQRFAGLFMNVHADSDVRPNYDPEHKILRSGARSYLILDGRSSDVRLQVLSSSITHSQSNAMLSDLRLRLVHFDAAHNGSKGARETIWGAYGGPGFVDGSMARYGLPYEDVMGVDGRLISTVDDLEDPEVCIENDEFCITNDEFCIQNDAFSAECEADGGGDAASDGYRELQHKWPSVLGIFQLKMQREWRIAPEKRRFCILKWPFILQFEVWVTRRPTFTSAR